MTGKEWEDEVRLPDEERFLSRWSRLKREANLPSAEESEEEPAQEGDARAMLTDADMPPLESLDENADYSGFLSPKVSDGLRQLALQKLFRSASFNVCDGLDDYAEDFTTFEKLGDIMTADLRFRLEQEARRRLAQEEAQSTPDDVSAGDGREAEDARIGEASGLEEAAIPAEEGPAIAGSDNKETIS